MAVFSMMASHPGRPTIRPASAWPILARNRRCCEVSDLHTDPLPKDPPTEGDRTNMVEFCLRVGRKPLKE